MGAQAKLEAFPVDGCKIAKAVLKNADTDKEYECCGVGVSGSTPVGGITAPFTYVTSVEDAEIQNLEGKICLVHTKLMKTKLYKKLVEKHALKFHSLVRLQYALLSKIFNTMGLRSV